MGLKCISSLVKFPFYFTVGKKRVERAFRTLPSHFNQQEALPRRRQPVLQGPAPAPLWWVSELCQPGLAGPHRK